MAVSDIIITPATVWYAPVATALPDETSVAYGAAWGGAWVSLGTTLEPVKLSFDKELLKLTIEQALSAVKMPVISEEAAIETVLAEMTAVNLALAMGGTSTVTAAGAAQKGFFAIEAGGEPAATEYAWGFEGYSVISAVKQPIRLFFYKGVATLGGELEFAKAKATGINLHVDAIPDTTLALGKQLMVLHRVTAPASS